MSARQIAQPQVTDAGPHQFVHFVTQLVKHPANLPIDSLLKDDAHDRRLERIDPFELGEFAIEHYPAKEFRGERWVPRSIQRDLIFLFDFVARVSEALREITVVRQDEQSFALCIEPTHVEKARTVRREEIEDRIARVWVTSSGDEAGRFMQDDVQVALRAHHFTPDFDVIARSRLCAEISANAAVDGNPTSGDQLIAVPAGTDTGGGEEAVQAHSWINDG